MKMKLLSYHAFIIAPYFIFYNSCQLWHPIAAHLIFVFLLKSDEIIPEAMPFTYQNIKIFFRSEDTALQSYIYFYNFYLNFAFCNLSVSQNQAY